MQLPSRRWVVAGVVSLLLAVFAYTGYRVLRAIHTLDPRAGLSDIVGLAGSEKNTPGTLAYKIDHRERVNILLLGYGGTGHDGAYLTDSMMVLSLEGPDRVAMVSIPRDTLVHIHAFANGAVYDGKINSAYQIPLSQGAFGQVSAEYDQGIPGAGKLASKVVGDYIGEPIDYWAGLDFAAFKKVVDAVGGIDVNNPYALDDDQYPLGETGQYTHIHFDAGPLHLNGDQALIYVRERHADSDFGRSKRQQQVLETVKDKALSVGAIPHLFDLLDALQDDFKTNMSIGDLKTFSGIAGKVKDSSTHKISLDTTNFQYDTYGYGGQYILLPRDKTLSALHHFIDSEMPDPAVLAEKSTVEFQSSFSQASEGQSLAGIWASVLTMIGFQTTPRRAPTGRHRRAPRSTTIRAARTRGWRSGWRPTSVGTSSPRLPTRRRALGPPPRGARRRPCRISSWCSARTSPTASTTRRSWRPPTLRRPTTTCRPRTVPSPRPARSSSSPLPCRPRSTRRSRARPHASP